MSKLYEYNGKYFYGYEEITRYEYSNLKEQLTK